jgi:hypothetical protein
MGGRPFFVVSQPVDPGLLQVLERDLIPRLEQEVPNQPSSEKLDADPLLHRFTVVFDREGYSPAFLARMKNRRIACGALRSSSTQSKHLVDTIKMVAHRGETAMVQIVRRKMTRHNDARSLLRSIYSTEVDIDPDPQAKTFTIRLHPFANPRTDRACHPSVRACA